MRQSTPYENRYCTGCQCTTRHEVKEVAYSCLRCGVVKYPSNMKQTSVRITNEAAFPVAHCA